MRRSVSEYGRRVFLTWWALVGLIGTAIGLVALFVNGGLTHTRCGSGYWWSPVEANSTKELRFVLAGADGGEVFAAEQTLTVPSAPIRGKPVLMNHVLGLAAVEFRKSGDYAFHVLIGGEEKKRASLFVNQPTEGLK